MITAHVRVTHPDRDDDVHPVTVIDPSGSADTPTIVDVPDFGLYAVGVHPELGPLGMYVIPTPGTDPEPAPARVRDDGVLEVALLADRITLVVEGHPLPGRTGSSDPDDEGQPMSEQAPESGTGDVNVEGDAVINNAPDGGGVDNNDDAAAPAGQGTDK